VANNYWVFSTMLPLDNNEQKNWWLDQMEEVYYTETRDEQGKLTELELVECEQDEVPEHDTEVPRIVGESAQRVLTGNGDVHDIDLMEALEFGLDFQWKMEQDGDKPAVWIYSDDGGNAYHAALVVRKMFQHFELPRSWWMTWATYCSKPRVDEQSGGAVVVTREGIHCMDAQTWARNKVKARGEFDG